MSALTYFWRRFAPLVAALVAPLAVLGALAALVSRPASADPTGGVDGALFRSAYDSGGVFSLEGARLLPRHDLSFALLVSYARAPLTLSVPGIGDAGSDRILNYLVTVDMAFGMSLTDRVAIGIDAAGYRTATGAGYGVRGRYAGMGQIAKPSTGLISLRPLSNLDPSAPSGSTGYLGDELAGPLDARFGLKVALVQRPLWALTAVGSVILPFGDDQMLLGDANLGFEPRLAFEWRRDRVRATRLIVNLGARIRERTVLQAYDPMTTGQTPADARAVLDVGSELVSGVGGVYELSPRLSVAGELVALLPLPDALSWGDCRLYSGARCSALASSGYVPGAHHGDVALPVTAGVMLRVTPDVTANLMLGTSLAGARGDQVRITTGIVWSPQPGGGMAAGRADRDGDGIPDAIDQCPDEPEDRDGFQDEDGCPDPDNDKDGIADAADRCPNEPEDKDGFQDEDGCPDPDNDKDGIPDALDKCPDEPEDKDGFQDEDGCPDDDNDGDGFPDAVDKCPNDPETVNGFEDDDGCPDVRGTTGPEERADRIDLKGGQVTFARGVFTVPSRQLLGQIATLIKNRRLAIRIEVHTALGTRSTNPAQIAAQHRRDKTLAQQRAKLIADYLVSQGVPAAQIQAVGIGSDRPLGTATPADPVNERVDFIKAQQGGTP